MGRKELGRTWITSSVSQLSAHGSETWGLLPLAWLELLFCVNAAGASGCAYDTASATVTGEQIS